MILKAEAEKIMMTDQKLMVLVQRITLQFHLGGLAIYFFGSAQFMDMPMVVI